MGDSDQDADEGRLVNAKLDVIQRKLDRVDSALSRRSVSLVFLMKSQDVCVMEIILIACSAWAAYVLAMPPSNFAAFPSGYRFVVATHNSEIDWALCAGIAALVKLIGLAWGIVSHDRMISRLIRSLGLGMSGIFWLLMGASTLVGNPDTMFGFTGIMMGVFAWWAIVRLLW